MPESKNTLAWTRQYLRHARGFHPARLLRERILARAIASLGVHSSLSVLDVGCGGGVFLSRLLDEGFCEVRGIEPNTALRAAALDRDPRLVGLVQDGEAENIPFPEAAFDGVYCFNVLHHLDSLEAFGSAFQEFDRVLRPGGVFVCLEPARPWLYSACRRGLRLLSPVLPPARRLHAFMAEEQELLGHFFRQRAFFPSQALTLGYAVQEDTEIVHQWLFAVRKP